MRWAQGCFLPFYEPNKQKAKLIISGTRRGKAGALPLMSNLGEESATVFNGPRRLRGRLARLVKCAKWLGQPRPGQGIYEPKEIQTRSYKQAEGKLNCCNN